METYNDIHRRIAIVETNYVHLSEDVSTLSDKIEGLSNSINSLTTTLAVVIDQRDQADKSLSRIKTAALTFFTALALTLVGFLIRIAFMVQGAHLPTP